MHVLILEDEIPAAERLVAMLKSFSTQIEVVAVLETTEEAIDYLKGDNLPDLIFSDIELADGLCFDLFTELELKIPVIFATAYNQYAIRAFEANAIDYLLKPLKREELERSLEKFRWRQGLQNPKIDYSEIAQSIANKETAPPKKYMVRFGQKMLLIEPNCAAYYYSMQKSSFAVMPSGKTYPLDESLNFVENDLDPSHFFRINRNLIVKRASIRDMSSESKGRLKLNLEPPFEEETSCIVSAERSPHFRKWLI